MTTCSIEGCDDVMQARTWCGVHYQAWRRHGDPLGVHVHPYVKCAVEDCSSERKARDWCNKHYARWKRHGDPLAVWVTRPTACSIPDCAEPPKCKGFCHHHYDKWRRHGDPLYSGRPGRAPLVHGTITGYGMHKCRCEECTAAQSVTNRRWRLLSKYGLTPEDYEAMIVAQQGVCLICAEPPRGREVLHVDHCHLTQQVRGLLCSPCNKALGLMRDDPNRLVTAAAYLLQTVNVLEGA